MKHAQRLVLLQGSDPDYLRLLQVSVRSNSAYARRHGYGFRAEVSLRTGIPGTGNWNRYFMLHEECKRGRYAWALWMDADAVVFDHRYPADRILDENDGKTLVCCAGSDEGEHDINNGVFFLNLQHPRSEQLLLFMIDRARRLVPEPVGFQDDQEAMHAWLSAQTDGSGGIACLRRYDGADKNRFNYDGPFIRHVLREHGDLSRRAERLQQFVDQGLRAG
jgi:hypothetical protein